MRCGSELSQASALTACCQSTWIPWELQDQQQLSARLGNFVSRSRVQEAVRALMGVRELSFAPGEKGPLIQLTVAPERVERVPSQF